MMFREEVSIPCGTLTLEGVVERPSQDDRPDAAAVICHPHPLYGGNMHNNVVKALKKGLLERNFECLRFNFRGTGRSWGSHGNGVDEEDDVLAAIDFILQGNNRDKRTLLVAGYSFGCWVSLKAVGRDDRASLLVGISPPTDVYDFSFLTEEKRPKLLIAGDDDFVCSSENFQELVDRIPAPKQGVLLPGADHFHVGREIALVQELNRFLDAYGQK
jgi:alpha/beta superfamily hydrolase